MENALRTRCVVVSKIRTVMQQVPSCFHISLVYRSSLEAHQCPTLTIEEKVLFDSWFRCSTPTQLYDQQVRKILHSCRLVWSFVKSQNKEIAVLEVHGRPWFSNVLQLKMRMIILMWIYSQVKKPVKCRINEKCTKTRVCLQKKPFLIIVPSTYISFGLEY